MKQIAEIRINTSMRKVGHVLCFYEGTLTFYTILKEMRFNRESFTKVVLSDVAEHLLPQQFMKTLEEIRRILVRDGILILTTPLTSKGIHCSTYAHIYEYSRYEIESTAFIR